MPKPRFTTKIALVILKDVLPWQELNVAAFLASAIAHHFPETMGANFITADEVEFLGVFRQPVLIFQASDKKLRKVYRKAQQQRLHLSIYPKQLFTTQGDDNLKAVAALPEEKLDLAGFVIYGPTALVDACTKGVSLHH